MQNGHVLQLQLMQKAGRGEAFVGRQIKAARILKYNEMRFVGRVEEQQPNSCSPKLYGKKRCAVGVSETSISYPMRLSLQL